MSRPRGTGIYPDDENTFKIIKKAWNKRKHGPSRTANIEPYLGDLEGPSREAKIKRMLRKLKADSEDIDPAANGVEMLADMLAGQTEQEQVETFKLMRQLGEVAVDLAKEPERDIARFRKRGLELDELEVEALRRSKWRIPAGKTKKGGGAAED